VGPRAGGLAGRTGRIHQVQPGLGTGGAGGGPGRCSNRRPVTPRGRPRPGLFPGLPALAVGGVGGASRRRVPRGDPLRALRPADVSGPCRLRGAPLPGAGTRPGDRRARMAPYARGARAGPHPRRALGPAAGPRGAGGGAAPLGRMGGVSPAGAPTPPDRPNLGSVPPQPADPLPVRGDGVRSGHGGPAGEPGTCPPEPSLAVAPARGGGRLDRGGPAAGSPHRPGPGCELVHGDDPRDPLPSGERDQCEGGRGDGAKRRPARAPSAGGDRRRARAPPARSRTSGGTLRSRTAGGDRLRSGARDPGVGPTAGDDVDPGGPAGGGSAQSSPGSAGTRGVRAAGTGHGAHPLFGQPGGGAPSTVVVARGRRPARRVCQPAADGSAAARGPGRGRRAVDGARRRGPGGERVLHRPAGTLPRHLERCRPG
jgi:hypothetical protein